MVVPKILVLHFCNFKDISVSIVYPLPIIDEIIWSLGGAKCFTKLDLAKGF